MSHTFKGNTCSIIHDGDYTGNVTIIRNNDNKLIVYCDDLLEFAAEYVRQEK